MADWFVSSRTLAAIRRFLKSRAEQAYLVGGYLRDGLLGRASLDLDVVVTGDASNLARGLADALRGAFYPLDPERDVGRIVLRRRGRTYLVDLAALRGQDIEEDLATRDFTLNALARDLQRGGELIDPHGGQHDIRDRVIRALSPTVFQDDPIRLLRAVRLAAELGFRIEWATQERMRADASALTNTSTERTRDELALLLALEAAPHLGALDELGILGVALPELADTSLREHGLRSVAVLERILADAPTAGRTAQSKAWSRTRQHLRGEIAGGRSILVVLKWVALLHGTAFAAPQHPPRSATCLKVLEEALRRLNLSNREVELGTHAVRALPQAWALPAEYTARHLYRAFREAREAGLEALFLALADEWSAREGPPEAGEEASWKDRLRRLGEILSRYWARDPVIFPPQLVSGEDLMRELGLAAGPRLGQLLAQIEEATAEGRLRNRREALAWAARQLRQRD